MVTNKRAFTEREFVDEMHRAGFVATVKFFRELEKVVDVPDEVQRHARKMLQLIAAMAFQGVEQPRTPQEEECLVWAGLRVRKQERNGHA